MNNCAANCIRARVIVDFRTCLRSGARGACLLYACLLFFSFFFVGEPLDAGFSVVRALFCYSALQQCPEVFVNFCSLSLFIKLLSTAIAGFSLKLCIFLYSITAYHYRAVCTYIYCRVSCVSGSIHNYRLIYAPPFPVYVPWSECVNN